MILSELDALLMCSFREVGRSISSKQYLDAAKDLKSEEM